MIPFAKRLATDLVFFVSLVLIGVQIAGFVTGEEQIASMIAVGLAGLTGAKRVSETPKP